MEPGRADGNVVPAEVIVFQLRLKQTGELALAGSVKFAGGYAGDQGGHGFALDFMENGDMTLQIHSVNYERDVRFFPSSLHCSI